VRGLRSSASAGQQKTSMAAIAGLPLQSLPRQRSRLCWRQGGPASPTRNPIHNSKSLHPFSIIHLFLSFNHSVIQSFSHSIINPIIMYIILVYDIGEKRVNKMLKLCRQYLNWIQNSVFEGELTEVKLKELISRAKDIMELETDSLIIFKTRQEKWLDKQIIGQEKSGLEQFL
jgi:CRISPR-associated protein Cas2